MARKRKQPKPCASGQEIEQMIADIEAGLDKLENVEFREAMKEVIQELRAENDFLNEVERSL